MSHDSRSSVTRALRRIVNATEDFVDEVIDRAGDVEHDLRHSLSRALDDEEHRPCRRRGSGGGSHHQDRDHDRRPGGRDHDRDEPKASVPRMRESDEVSALREQINELTRRVEQLSDAPK